MFSTLFAQIDAPQPGADIDPGPILAIFFAVILVLLVFILACTWKIFTKAGQPGWASIIPIYNYLVLLKIVGRPAWWILLLLIPGVGFIFGIIVTYDLCKSFGKDVGFLIGLIFLAIVFLPVLAFGNARYRGPAALMAAG